MNDQPNPVLSDIYSTFGMSKEASEGGEMYNLSNLAHDVALRTAAQYGIEGIDKIAQLEERVLEVFAEADHFGRVQAQQNFTMLEKQAAEGDADALNAFFGLDRSDDPAEALKAELVRRIGG